MSKLFLGRPSLSGRPRGQRASARLQFDRLEDRRVPATLLGLTATNSLVRFDSATPATIQSTVAITGLQTGESILGIDYRPATSQLFGVGSTSRVYAINAATGVATEIGNGPFNPALSGTFFGVNFNPVPDRIRVVGDSGQNLRLDPGTGLATMDTALAFDAADQNMGQTPRVVAVAYTNSLIGMTPTTTTLYGIDSSLDALVQVGGPEGMPSPNGGLLFTVGSLGLDFSDLTGFDIAGSSDEAFATRVVAGATELASINLTFGSATTVGLVGGGNVLRSLAVLPAADGAGSIQIEGQSFTVDRNGAPLVVTVSRTGGATGTVTVDYTTTDATAKAGTDYLASSGTLTFATGETTKSIALSGIPNISGGPAQPTKTFTLTLSNAGGGATLGANTSATVSVIDGIPPVPAPVRLFAVGAGQGGFPIVRVYNSVSGAFVRDITAYNSFAGGVAVATGDVNGDGTDDIITGAGAGGGPHVKAFDGSTGALLRNFFAYSASFRGGVNVAAGDINGDGFADIVTGAGASGGPHVKAFDGQTGAEIRSFFAYSAAFFGGVNVATGNFNGDSNADIVTGAGAGGGPHVKVFDGLTGGELRSFFAFDAAFTGGVSVAAGDTNGDGQTDVIVGAGAGGVPQVRIFNGATGAAIGSFLAYDASFRGGVRVSTNNVDGAGSGDIITGAGPSGGPHVKSFDSATFAQRRSFFAFDPGFTGGVFVG